jgi:hypothetical protein
MLKVIVRGIDCILIAVMFTAIALLDSDFGDICGVITLASAFGLFIMYKVEERYVYIGE